MEKKMIIVGAIGNTARQNRDRFRVFARGGYIGSICSRDYKGSQLVIRLWRNGSSKSDKHPYKGVKQDKYIREPE